MYSNAAALIACESVLDPILEQLTTVLDEHSANFAGPVADALERLRSTAADTSLTVSAAILETLGPIPPRRRWALVRRPPPGSRRLTCCCVRSPPVVPSTASSTRT
jgi:hypothetical protein